MKKLLFLLTLVLITHLSSAQDKILNYQGVLLDNQGQPVADDTYSAVFELFNVETNGSALWTDSNVSITTKNGAFSVELGSGNSTIPSSIDFTKTLWLRIAVSGSNFASRVRINPAPAVLSAKDQMVDNLADTARAIENRREARLQAKVDSMDVALKSLTSSLQTALSALETVVENRGSSVPIGTVQAFAGDSSKIPTGWLLCDGKSYRVEDYSELEAVLKLSWGTPTTGNDFRVPDLRGMFLRGVDYDRGLDPDKNSRVTMYNNGQITGNVVGSTQDHQLDEHFHRMTKTYSIEQGVYFAPSNSTSGHITIAVGTGPSSGGSSNDNWGGTGNFGGGETRPVNAYINYIIKAK